MRTLAALVLVATAASSASADTLIGGVGEWRWSRTHFTGELAEELGGSWLGWQMGAGFVLGRFTTSVSAGFSTPHAVGVETYDPTFSQWTLGTDVKFRIGPVEGFRGYLRAGARRHWIDGSFNVTRRCSEFSVCDAGFWVEQPSYSGFAVDLGIGFEWLAPILARDNTILGLALDLGYQRLTYVRVDRRRTGGMMSISLGMTVGGGRLRPGGPARPGEAEQQRRLY